MSKFRLDVENAISDIQTYIDDLESGEESTLFIGSAELAAEALKKLVPVKPISKYPHRSGNVCPACETELSCRILLFEKYCPDCGQCVDWG